MTQPDLDSFFSGGGGKSLSWKNMPIGTSYTGVIKAVYPPQQATDPATGEPAFVKATNKPKMQVRVELATDYRDPTDPEDDGSRNLYIGGWMTGAVGDAIRKAGAQGPPKAGGRLTVTLSEREAPANAALNPTNKFTAEYVPPAGVQTGDFFAQSGQQAGQQFAAQTQVPVPSMVPGGGYVQPPAQPQAPQTLTPEQIAQYMAASQQQAPAAPPAPPQLVKPAELSQQVWDSMDDSVKQAVVNTLGSPGQGGIPF